MSKRPCSSDAAVEAKRQRNSTDSSPDKVVLADDEVLLNIVLSCEQTTSSGIKQVHFKSLPTTPLEIKKKIEEDFSIPSCVQTLHYQSMILKDSDQLQCTHFRSGDTLTVNYPIEAECKMTQNVLKWLKELYDLLKSCDSESDVLSSSKIDTLILEGERNNTVQDLSRNLFIPWSNKRKLMNKFYFQHEGGLDILMKVYGILVSKEWGEHGIFEENHIDLERTCSWAICNCIQTFPLRRQVFKLGGLEMCSTTLLRRQLQGDDGIFAFEHDTLRSALFTLHK